jgi:hypothetical protein
MGYLTTFGVSLSVVLLAVGRVSAGVLFVGSDINGPVHMYTPSGTSLGDIGQTNAIGVGVGGQYVWTVVPGPGLNRVECYDALGTRMHGFTASVGGNHIADMAYGGNNTLWASTYEGNIFHIDATTGATLGSFDAPGSNLIGVAFDGTNLWATAGLLGSDAIHKLDTQGNLIATINTGFSGAAGLGYDSATNTLWAGYFGLVRQFDLNGNLLSSFATNTPLNQGLEVRNASSITEGDPHTPEPATLVVFGLMAVGALGYATRRKRATP